MSHCCQNQAWKVGEDIALVFSPDAEQADTDITGWTLRFRLYASQGGAVLFTLTTGAGITITDAEDGEFTVAIPAATTAMHAAGIYWHDVWRTNAGSTYSIADGQVKVTA